jgi:hypothetical protein
VRIELRNLTPLRKPTAFMSWKAVSGRPFRARTAGIAGVRDRGMLPKGSPVNPGELAISSDKCAKVLRIRSGTGSVGHEGRAHGSKHALTEDSRHQGQLEVVATDSPAVLRAHTTDEGGEPQGSRKGRPGYPLEGRGEQMDGVTR